MLINKMDKLIANDVKDTIYMKMYNYHSTTSVIIQSLDKSLDILKFL